MKSKRGQPRPLKVTDESTPVRCATGYGLVREEVWKDGEGNVVRYSLAFINFHLFAGDHGRVLGYDTAHGYAHRHYLGEVERISDQKYGDVFQRFLTEVAQLRTRTAL